MNALLHGGMVGLVKSVAMASIRGFKREIDRRVEVFYGECFIVGMVGDDTKEAAVVDIYNSTCDRIADVCGGLRLGSKSGDSKGFFRDIREKVDAELAKGREALKALL